MNKNEKSQLTKVLEKLARIDERLHLGFKKNDEDHADMKKHTETMNEEMGTLEERIGRIENLYFEAKARYDKMSTYWKVVALILSPLVTFLVMTGIKLILGMPIP